MPRPPPALDPPHRAGLRADQVLVGLLEGRPVRRLPPADLRHRLGHQGRSQGLPDPPGRGRQARPPQARRRARPLLLPRGDRPRPGGLPPQGRHAAPPDRAVRRRPPPGLRLRLRPHPRDLQGRALPHLRAPALLRRHHVPAHARRRGARRRGQHHQGRPGVLPQGHELPDAQPHLPLPRTLLPRAAAALLRDGPRLPLREVRCRPRAHPHARLHPGRLPHLLHPGAGR